MSILVQSFYGCSMVLTNTGPCADLEGGGTGRPPPLKNHKNMGFLSNIGPDPL